MNSFELANEEFKEYWKLGWEEGRENALDEVEKIVADVVPLSYYYEVRDKIRELRKQKECGEDMRCHGECSGEVDGEIHCPVSEQGEKQGRRDFAGELITAFVKGHLAGAKREREKVIKQVLNILARFPSGYTMVEDSHGNRWSALEYCRQKIEKLREQEKQKPAITVTKDGDGYNVHVGTGEMDWKEMTEIVNKEIKRLG
jgi:hypothetical protein